MGKESIKINDINISKSDFSKALYKSKIEAVVFIRKNTGVSLKEAKDIVDALEKDVNYFDHKEFQSSIDQQKYKFNHSSKKKGTHFISNKTKPTKTLFLLLVVIIILGILYYMKK
ncbi:ribosomal L7/L12 family protein [Tenacibaculum agarivorans]|uniref:hypothetical protein n=1 Tax=Tenacibaculum agarivorans TaxID=1908389 RepID=UPI00094B963A|nr:hypothetical protein [Tenacibaculum agarivorans]